MILRKKYLFEKMQVFAFQKIITICRNLMSEAWYTIVVKEGSMAPFQNGAMLPSLEPKWGHTALPGGQYGPILSQIAKMGPYCPPWRAVWPHPPAWSKEGKGGVTLAPGRAIWVLETPSPAWSKEGKGS